MTCGRNKATSMVKELGKQSQDLLSERMKISPFTLSTDGSNDVSAKQFPMVVRCFNPVKGMVDSELLSIPVCNGSATGKYLWPVYVPGLYRCAYKPVFRHDIIF